MMTGPTPHRPSLAVVDWSLATRPFLQSGRFFAAAKGQLPLVGVASAAAAAVAAAATTTAAATSSTDENDKSKRLNRAKNRLRFSEVGKSNLTVQGPLHPVGTSVMATSAAQPPTTSLVNPWQDGPQKQRNAAVTGKDDAAKAIIAEEYDFVVVGNGNAGRRAARTLTELCPDASVAVIDPILASARVDGGPEIGGGGGGGGGTTHLPLAAVGFDPSDRTVRLSDGRTTVRFRQSALLATGARGSPPPPSLVDDRANGRVLELRSTEVAVPPGVPPGVPPLGSPPSSSGGPGGRTRRPVLSPEGVRRMTVLAATQGAKVGVLGSGVEALELAAAAAGAASERDDDISAGVAAEDVKSKQKRRKDDEPNVALIFGSAGPLSSRLPRYLSTYVAKRLRQHGIDVQERTLVRYVAMMDHHQQQGLEVHTAKSYDTMDTRRTDADLLVVAPSVEGQKGTAVVPTMVPRSCDGASTFSSLMPTSFNSWANLSSASSDVPSAVTCYVDDGRIAVNAELSAASRVYAAGSVAKYPNCTMGHAAVAGGGCIDARIAGEVAAHNMAREYHERSAAVPFDRRTVPIKPRFFSTEASQVWSTTQNLVEGKHISSPLQSLGIHALCVGNCDSETMATHGFWWTNQSSDNKKKSSSSVLRGQGDTSLARRRSTKRSSTMRRSVYGSGVVFYLDRNGKIRGIMSWGLPFTTETGEDGSSLNVVLVGRMKELLRTNGEICKAQHMTAVLERDGRLDTSKLSSFHLSEESKLLASMALSDSSESRPLLRSQIGQVDKVASIAHPLHRYVPSKPAAITGIGTLKRRDVIGNGGVGEDIFVRVARTDENEGDRPSSLVHVYPLRWGGGSEGAMKNVFSYTSNEEESSEGDQSEKDNDDDDRDARDFELSMKAEKVNEIRSRPPKEEPLWMREGDANRSISMADVVADMFMLNMRRGRFHDGSDSVKQAPTDPKTYN